VHRVAHKRKAPEGKPVRHRLTWLLLVILAIVILALVLQRGDDTLAGMSGDDISALIIRIVMAAVVGAFALTMFRGRLSQALEAVLIWVVIGLILAVGYTYRFELREVADRVLAEFMPGRAVTRGRVVEIARGSGGNFSVNAQVNGARIAMVLDTGATSVVLTQEAAKAAGLPLEILAYTVTVETANGRARAAPVTLDRVAVGGIVERAVPALIAQPGQLRTNLLGMSFLTRLESWEVRGERLILRGYP
jgi:aspartyl protease family protein